MYDYKTTCTICHSTRPMKLSKKVKNMTIGLYCYNCKGIRSSSVTKINGMLGECECCGDIFDMSGDCKCIKSK